MCKTAKTIVAVIATAILAISAFAITGCSGIPFLGGGGGKTLTSESVQIAQNAKNPLVNDSLMLTVTGIQRRPLSVFQGSSVKEAGSQAGSGRVDSSSSDFVIVEVDMNIEYNANTLMSSAEKANIKASTLEDLLLPGELMMITGKDQNGGDYTSCDILIPETDEETQAAASSSFSNGDWDYSLIKSELPTMSQTKSGSILFKVSPTASDLKLVIVTANGNPLPLDAEAVQNGNKKVYYLDI